jgi:hypothetical protein
MKRTYIYILLGILILFSSCSDTLDKKNLNSIAPQDVWNDVKLAKAYIDRLYFESMPRWDANHDNINGSNSSSGGDFRFDYESKSDESNGGAPMMNGTMTEEATQYFPYNKIRNINILLQDIDAGNLDADFKDQLKGQAYFLRALHYYELVIRYGGVPILLKPQMKTDDLFVKRNKTSEVFARIVADLDEAANLLPAKWTGVDVGRITSGAALALKGRVLLYYASPLLNRSGDAARWTDAYHANKAAKDFLEANGAKLHTDFSKIFLDVDNDEVVLQRKYQYGAYTNRWEAGTRPLSESLQTIGYNVPSVEMVSAFPMKDGMPINESLIYDTLFYWKNRDPRFYSTVAYNGCLYPLSGKSERRQWTYGGNPEETTYNTSTGFYCRKGVNPENDAYTAAYQCETPWIEIRFAEVMMNLAECAAETGKPAEAYEILKAIRQRAGIEAGDNGMYGLKDGLTGAPLVNSIMEERRIEFAFEAKRHWDMKRRMLFENLRGMTRRNLQVILNPKLDSIYNSTQDDAHKVVGYFDMIKDTLNLDRMIHDEYLHYFTHRITNADTEVNDETGIGGVQFLPNYYFYAIHPNYIRQNPNLEQTTGWSGGTFDPYQ